MHSQNVHTFTRAHTCSHTYTPHTFGCSHDFGSGPSLQHAADERIRLEELRKKVKMFFCLNLWWGYLLLLIRLLDYLGIIWRSKDDSLSRRRTRDGMSEFDAMSESSFGIWNVSSCSEILNLNVVLTVPAGDCL